MAEQLKVPETSRSYQKSIKGLSRSADRLWSQTNLKRWQHMPAHNSTTAITQPASIHLSAAWGNEQTQSEWANGWRFCVFAKGVCSLRLRRG